MSIELIKERNRVKISNVHPLNLDPQYMKVLEDDITCLLDSRDKEIEGLKEEIRLLKDGLIPKPEYRKLVFRKETKTIWEVNQKGEYLHNTGIRAEETK